MTRPFNSDVRQKLNALLCRLKLTGHDEFARERAQSTTRVVISAGIFLYMAIAHPEADFRDAPPWLVFTFGFVVLSVLIMALTHHSAVESVPRRVVANALDVSAVTYLMIHTGEYGIPLFLVYLWVTLANGSRFGARAMVIGAGFSVVGFSLVLALSPVWKHLIGVSASVMAALVLLPVLSGYLSSGHPRTLGQAARSIIGDQSRLLDRERGQALTRLAVCSAVFVYLIASHYPVTSFAPWLIFCFGYLALSALVATLVLIDAAHSAARRTVANIADVVAITYLMIALDDLGIPLFILYLWITLGNGFRYGVNAMLVSSALSVLGFSAVIALSPLWQAQPSMAAGVLAGLVVLIPGYTAPLIRKLHEARQRAEEASTAKSHFLARMSHELRTPLNGILGTAELLGASKRLTREDRSLLDVIKDSVQVSMRQIDNVLDFSKIEAGKLVIEQVNFDMHELLNRATRLVRAIALDKNLRLTLRIDPAMPYRLVGDPHHLHEVLLNLLSNAIKFTEKGYVSLEAHLLEADNNSALIRFEAYDTGIGIEQAALDRIFEAFTQEDTATTRRYGGTGLGTTIAKQLVQLMGGELRAESVKGQGSRFHADIRFARQPEAKTAAADGGFAGMQALLISEDSQLGGRVESLLEDWDVSLTVAASVPEALGFLARGIRMGNPVHAVLADSHAVYTDSGVHCADDFLDKAALSLTPVFMLADVSPDQAELRRWGYTAVVSYDLPRALLYNALRSARVYDSSGSERGVLQIEPWAWGRPGRIRPKLLVADDNRTNLMILRKILEAAHYEVDTAENGEQALELLLRGRYKAAILDMHMPGLDGVAVIKQYRVLRAGVRVPIIMLTANATIDAKLQSAEAGADAYLTKPATSGEVLSTIKKLVDDTQIHTLPNSRAHTSAVLEPAVLDKQVIMELDRLYGSPPEVSRLLDTFELEGRRLLHDLEAAFANKNHAAFCDLIHALKGNGANVGAVRLVQACREVESCGMLDFRRDGKQMLARLEAAFAEASTALREFTAVGETNPARGTDLH